MQRNLNHWAISHTNVEKAPKLNIIKITGVRIVRPQKIGALAQHSKKAY